MKKNVVFDYYNGEGWKKINGTFVDTTVNENLQCAAQTYNAETRRRITAEIGTLPEHERRRLLDCASGPVHYPEYIEYSESFCQRYCVEFSVEALKQAKQNLQKAGQNECVFLCQDLFDIDFEEGYFDAAISLHTIYHVHLTKQREFVERLIRSVRPGGKIVIVYSNPLSLRACLCLPVYLWHLFKKGTKSLLIRLSLFQDKRQALYFKRKSIFWWRRFKCFGEVQIKAYRFLTPSAEKILIPDNSFGRRIYSWLYWLESKKLAAFLADYYMIVIAKNADASEP